MAQIRTWTVCLFLLAGVVGFFYQTALMPPPVMQS